MFIDKIHELLNNFSNNKVYAIVDGAGLLTLYENLRKYEPQYRNLYNGVIAVELKTVSPYLIQLDLDTEFYKWLLINGFNKNTLSFYISNKNIESLKNHFSNYALVELETPDLFNSRFALYAFYDPRVLNGHLTSLNSAELKYFFDPMDYIICEDAVQKCVIHKYRFEGSSFKIDSYRIA